MKPSRFLIPVSKPVLGFMIGIALCINLNAHAQHSHDHGDGNMHSHALKDADYHMELRNSYTAEAPRWWKGNTHTHTWWSDGDSPPEIVAAWYREHDYDFLVLSDHNIMQKGNLQRGTLVQWPTFWYTLEREEHHSALASYRKHFGDDWVETREKDGKTEVRLRTLDEFRHLFEAPDEFIFVMGEEITERYEAHPVHINGVNLQDVIAPRDGGSVAEVMQNNLNAVFDQEIATGREMIAHVNHPNFRYAITVEDMLALNFDEGEGFFELYNGHHGVENYGDQWRVGLERMWDIVLATRISQGKAPLYGIANDDAHSFAAWKIEQHSNPGRGWVMVRSTRLTPDYIVGAMKRGDFYNSTGVTLSELTREGKTLALTIDAEEGVDYTVEFIGTRRGVDLKGKPLRNVPNDIQGRVSQEYSDKIGLVLATVKGTKAKYELKNSDLYVRARITSTISPAGIPPPFKGSGARRVHNTTLVSRGLPDVTPRVKGFCVIDARPRPGVIVITALEVNKKRRRDSMILPLESNTRQRGWQTGIAAE